MSFNVRPWSRQRHDFWLCKPFGLDSWSKATVESKSAPQKIKFWGRTTRKSGNFHAVKTSDQIGHTCVWPQKLRWPRAPRSLNPSMQYTHATRRNCSNFQIVFYCIVMNGIFNNIIYYITLTCSISCVTFLVLS